MKKHTVSRSLIAVCLSLGLIGGVAALALAEGYASGCPCGESCTCGAGDGCQCAEACVCADCPCAADEPCNCAKEAQTPCQCGCTDNQ